MASIYELITNRIVSLLERGTVPWHRPWGGPDKHPKNLVSGKGYRGVNVFLLSAGGYESPWWLTFKQAKERGGYVRKGEQGSLCLYWNWYERRDKDSGEFRKAPFLRYYIVFNVLQCEGIEYPRTQPGSQSTRRGFSPIEECERVLSGMPNPPRIKLEGERACYLTDSDVVSMPPRNSFDSNEAYYSVLFHELTHSTGHFSRLSRPGITEPIVFGSPTYSREELTAEMGAAFLCGEAGIENKVIENSASYIDNWRRKLKGDSTLVVKAASQAQKAADYVLNRKWEEGDGEVRGSTDEVPSSS